MKKLIDENPLLVLPSLATKIGLSEAIFVQQIHYWLSNSKHEYEGCKWIYNTYDEWQKNFPFWSVSTIKRLIKKLEDQGYLISGNFNKSKIDKTKWYTINYKLVEGEETLEESPLGQNEQSSGQSEQSIGSKWADHRVNLNKAIPEITTESTSENKKDDEEEGARTVQLNPFKFYEQNGFGTIGSHVGEKIGRWCDDLSDELVIEAMKIATEFGAKTWRYVESILRNWEDKNIKTVDQVKALQLEHKEKKGRSSPNRGNQSKKQEIKPDWFDEEKQRRHEALQKQQKEDFDFEAERKRLEEEIRKGGG